MPDILWPVHITSQFVLAGDPFDIINLISGVDVEIAVLGADGAVAGPGLEDLLLRPR